MIGIIDYGSGNLRSVYNAFKYIGEKVEICDDADKLSRASKIILPGVGSSLDALKGLEERALVGPLLERIEKGKIICGFGQWI